MDIIKIQARMRRGIIQIRHQFAQSGNGVFAGVLPTDDVTRFFAEKPFPISAVLVGLPLPTVAGKCGGFGRLFDCGGFTFSGQGGTATLRNRLLFLPGGIVGCDGQAGRLRQAFLSVVSFCFAG